MLRTTTDPLAAMLRPRLISQTIAAHCVQEPFRLGMVRASIVHRDRCRGLQASPRLENLCSAPAPVPISTRCFASAFIVHLLPMTTSGVRPKHNSCRQGVYPDARQKECYQPRVGEAL